ncbi:hypothetical protein SCT_3076 [Sulfuricella sp. T08]|nr:hypothetical protein SCT_3076 [Sulfuricella sp. T08]
MAHSTTRLALEELKMFHTHPDENGLMVKCYHKSKTVLLSVSFWLGLTLGFPVEHFLWEKIWPFKLLTRYIGL